MAFTMNNPYGDEKSATAAANKEKKADTKYDKAIIDQKNRTVSIHGTKTTSVKPNAVARGGSVQATDQGKYMADLAKRFPGSSGEQLAKKGKEGSFISQSMIDTYNKKYYKPKTTTHDIKTSWDGDLKFPENPTTEPGEDFTPQVDGGGMPAEDIVTNPINTKVGDLSNYLQGKGSRLTKRVEESTDLGAEGFDSEGTPLKTRGLANKDWGLA